MRVELDRATLLPGESVTAAVVGADRVTAARLELGFESVFASRWAGRRDAAMRHDPAVELLDFDALGTNQGADRETREWVSVPRPVCDRERRRAGPPFTSGEPTARGRRLELEDTAASDQEAGTHARRSARAAVLAGGTEGRRAERRDAEASALYAGWTGDVGEEVRRELIVYNA